MEMLENSTVQNLLHLCALSECKV